MSFNVSIHRPKNLLTGLDDQRLSGDREAVESLLGASINGATTPSLAELRDTSLFDWVDPIIKTGDGVQVWGNGFPSLYIVRAESISGRFKDLPLIAEGELLMVVADDNAW